MKKLVFPLFFLAIGPTSFSGPGPSPAPSAFATSHNHFAFQLLSSVLQHDSSHCNIAISPIATYLSLGMVYNAAGHATKDSIAAALGATEFGEHNLNELCQGLVRDMSQQDPHSSVMLVDAIYNNRNRGAIQPAFADLCERYFYSPVKSISFGGRSTAAQINKWVDLTTRHRVSNIIPAVNPADRLYLINAMSFQADWAAPFDVADTKDEVFVTARGRARTVPFMKKELAARVYSDTSFTMIDLPFGNGKDYDCILVLPDDPDLGMQDFIVGFSESRMYEAMARMNQKWVELSLPRWDYGYSPENMAPVFRDMGMGILLNDYGNADLSMMSRTGLHNARHTRKPSPMVKAFCKTYIAMNENGSQTGMVTASPANHGYSLRRHQTQTIRMDRPFFYAIISRQQQVILLTGIVNDPSQ